MNIISPVVLKSIIATEFQNDYQAIMVAPRESRREMMETLIRKAIAYDESKHPRAKNGRFLAKDAIHEAKTDPVMAEKLRDAVKPEDAEKLEDAISGKTDLGRTKAGQRKHEAATRREAKKDSEAEVMRVTRAMGEGGEGITSEHLEALVEHLPRLNKEQLRAARIRVRERFGWGRSATKGAMVDKLAEWARNEAAKIQDAPAEGPTTPEVATAHAQPLDAKTAPGAIASAFNYLRENQAGSLVTMADLRKTVAEHFGPVDRATFDDAVHELRRGKHANFMSDSMGKTDDADAVQGPGERYAYMEAKEGNRVDHPDAKVLTSKATEHNPEAVKAALQEYVDNHQRTNTTAMTPIHEMRAAMAAKFPGLSHLAFDEAVTDQFKRVADRKHHMLSISDRSQATADQIKASIPHVGETMFYVTPNAEHPANQKPAPDVQPAAPVPAEKPGKPKAKPKGKKINYANALTIAADDVTKLRRPDVYRVIDSMQDDANIHGMAEYISKNRPELASEVTEAVADIINGRKHVV